MDVHPPHEPIRSWKDFSLHLVTITISAVEAMHHRHMVKEARANLRREMVENQRLYTQNLRSVQTELVQLEQNIEQLRELRAGKTPEHFDLQWDFNWNGFVESAWMSARDIGAVGYMQPEVIEEYSGLYRQQTFVNEAGVGIFFGQAKAAAPLLTAKNRKDPKELLPGDIQAMLLSAGELEGRVKTLQATMKTLEVDYTRLLLQP